MPAPFALHSEDASGQVNAAPGRAPGPQSGTAPRTAARTPVVSIAKGLNPNPTSECLERFFKPTKAGGTWQATSIQPKDLPVSDVFEGWHRKLTPQGPEERAAGRPSVVAPVTSGGADSRPQGRAAEEAGGVLHTPVRLPWPSAVIVEERRPIYCPPPRSSKGLVQASQTGYERRFQSVELPQSTSRTLKSTLFPTEDSKTRCADPRSVDTAGFLQQGLSRDDTATSLAKAFGGRKPRSLTAPSQQGKELVPPWEKKPHDKGTSVAREAQAADSDSQALQEKLRLKEAAIREAERQVAEFIADKQVLQRKLEVAHNEGATSNSAVQFAQKNRSSDGVAFLLDGAVRERVPSKAGVASTDGQSRNSSKIADILTIAEDAAPAEVYAHRRAPGRFSPSKQFREAAEHQGNTVAGVLESQAAALRAGGGVHSSCKGRFQVVGGAQKGEVPATPGGSLRVPQDCMLKMAADIPAAGCQTKEARKRFIPVSTHAEPGS